MLGKANARRDADDLISCGVGSSQAMIPIFKETKKKGTMMSERGEGFFRFFFFSPLAPWLMLMILCTKNSLPVGNFYNTHTYWGGGS